MAGYDVAVIGAGVVGLAHAWAAARRGKSVAVFERSPRAQGASVRNFGMVWPIGQPPGPLLDAALVSRRLWLELARDAGLWLSPCGSLHLAHADDEWAVLEEFMAARTGHECELLTPAQTLARCPAVNPEGLRGALYSPSECCVEPREAVAKLAAFLADRHGVEVRFSTAVVGVDEGRLTTAAGEVVRAGRVLVCSGAEFEALFPEVFAESGLRRCKLQMMRTATQPGGWRMGPHLAGGLTLCHYAAFRDCPTLPALRARVEAECAEYVRYGIHVMASQNAAGEVVVGDSHEYDGDIEVFDKAEIDGLILAYLRKMARLPDWGVAARWHGIYAKHPTLPVFRATARGAEIISSPGGAGMTLSFGLAEAWAVA